MGGQLIAAPTYGEYQSANFSKESTYYWTNSHLCGIMEKNQRRGEPIMKKLYEKITSELLSGLVLTVGERTLTDHAQVYGENGAHCTYLTGDDGMTIALDVDFLS